MRRSGEETRREIVENALQLFSVKGYHNTSINDLLAATGLTKGGLYGHFSSKEEVYGAAYQRAVEIWKRLVFRGVARIEDPLSRIGRVVEQDLRDYVGARVFAGGCFFFKLLVELSDQSPEMAAPILKGFEGFENLLATWLCEAGEKGLLREGVDPREVAEFIVVVVNGATALYTARDEPEVLEGTIRQLKRHLDDLRA